MSPKRALFSLNVDSNAENLYERIEDHNREGNDKLKVIEHNQPTTGSSRVEISTRPFERAVERTVERFVDGKATTEKAEYSSSSSAGKATQGVKKTRNIKDEYDTSDL